MPKSLKKPGVMIASSLSLIAFIFLLAKILIPSLGHMTHGFPGYYTAARLLVQGRLGPQAYDNHWFIGQVHALVNPAIDEIMAPSLPTAALIVLPFIFLPPRLAREAWLWFNLVFLLAGLGLLLATYRRLHPDNHTLLSFWPLIFPAFAFLFPPVAANFYIGQAIILFFCLLSLSLFGLISQQDHLVGLALGLAFILKAIALPLWLLLLVQRRWPALGWGLGTVAAVALLSLPWIGPDTWWAFLQTARSVTAGPTLTVPAYQTTAGFFNHLFLFDPVWNPHPVADWPGLAKILTLFVSLSALTLTLWFGRAETSMTKLFAALIILGVILLPVAEDHHFVLLLIPIFILIDDLLQPSSMSEPDLLGRSLLGLALLLLVVPIPHKQPALSVGWLAILTYPRLFGAWLLWLIAIRRFGSISNPSTTLRTGFQSSITNLPPAR